MLKMSYELNDDTTKKKLSMSSLFFTEQNIVFLI